MRARLAVIAVLDERHLDILAAQQIDKIERMAPGHVGVAHALQDAHRQVEMQRATIAEQMVAALLDQMLGDRIRIAVERRLVIDAVALELGSHLGAHAVPHQPLGHVEGRRDQHETRQPVEPAGFGELAREQERDPAAHR